jgi:hypothetical protein
VRINLEIETTDEAEGVEAARLLKALGEILVAELTHRAQESAMKRSYEETKRRSSELP